MTRAVIIVSAWLLLAGGIREEALLGTSSPLALLGLYLLISVATVAALWAELSVTPASGDHPARRPREIEALD